MQQSFHALGVSNHVCSALSKRGISAPFAVQELVVADALAGRDILVKSPTGTGKTLAFAIPLAERLDSDIKATTGLVLVPTRELASQVAEELRAVASACGLRVAVCVGGVGIEAQARKAQSAHILVATPGRLEDLVARRRVRLDKVTTFVIDEADRMLDLGFKPAVTRIASMLPADRQTMFFSATLDGDVGRLAEAFTRDPKRFEVAPPPRDEAAIEHRFVTVENDDKISTLVELLRAERELALVFVRTRRGAARLAKKLETMGVSTAALHGDMTQAQRTKSLTLFSRGTATTLVATDVAARGLDVDDVSHVINFDPPGDDASYVHRVGRTGRAGRTGTGITLVTPDQREDVSRMARAAGVEAKCSRTGELLAVPRAARPSRGPSRGYRGRRPHSART